MAQARGFTRWDKGYGCLDKKSLLPGTLGYVGPILLHRLDEMGETA